MGKPGLRALVVGLPLLLWYGCQQQPSNVPLGGEDTDVAARPEQSSEQDRTAPKQRAATETQSVTTPKAPPREETQDGGTEPTTSLDGDAAQTRHEKNACTDDPPELGDCTMLLAPVEGCAQAAAVRRYCARANELLEPRVARAYFDCVYEYTSTVALCNPKLHTDCLLSATKRRCSADSMTEACSSLRETCPALPGFFQKNCSAVLGSLKRKARDRTIACLRNCDLAACLGDIVKPVK